MDYEKAYKEALERARKLYKDAVTLQLEQDIKDYEYIFPELAESEDERIRKEIIEYLIWLKDFRNGCYDPSGKYVIEDMIAWLEKQGKQEQVSEFKADDWYISKVDGKIHNIYHSDKVEPKFKVGNWIVNNDTGNVFQVTEIKDDEYCLCPFDAEIMGYLRIIDVDNEYHLYC